MICFFVIPAQVASYRFRHPARDFKKWVAGYIWSLLPLPSFIVQSIKNTASCMGMVCTIYFIVHVQYMVGRLLPVYLKYEYSKHMIQPRTSCCVKIPSNVPYHNHIFMYYKIPHSSLHSTVLTAISPLCLQNLLNYELWRLFNSHVYWYA